jgi:hypothetical protein
VLVANFDRLRPVAFAGPAVRAALFGACGTPHTLNLAFTAKKPEAQKPEKRIDVKAS